MTEPPRTQFVYNHDSTSCELKVFSSFGPATIGPDGLGRGATVLHLIFPAPPSRDDGERIAYQIVAAIAQAESIAYGHAWQEAREKPADPAAGG